MIKYEIYYNKVYKNSCNLIKEVRKGHYLHIDQVNKTLIIDNIQIAKLEEINQIRFLIHGYYQTINIAEPNAKIVSTNVEFPQMEGGE